ncbi:MAG: YbaK/EbsC family protein [Clostridia bacterium]|jgi:prolyl-tRNA editing enzyme YbaK/EbsC (Cys-tRNA(Pro) deacylase)|nr:YbaK/EbsC family protein [Clostridia bacterium]MCI1998931.1 YbaK/EbsC family protein [Clostridia bacterium]MCI2013681.1 YbaK/EbsC family protein [Clostridia bacterium]
MSVEAVKKYLEKYGRDSDIMEFDVSSATVELAAKALNVIPAMITKTLAFKKDGSCILIGTAGDTKVDNKKFKSEFGVKAKMLTPEETLEMTGHAIGGVCAFAVPENVKSYLDISLKRFEYVFPACGSSNSAIKLTCDELFELSKSEKWVDVCKNW